ncbi:hypothetical protein [Bacillus xiapuensis]|uniref:hypothetical protein n=1 Tax=Bacillus xiapuensis TaxID=2014075 RepID=UPI0012FD4427|nr:hypothetical protein [Bacillus xiapuensis]
MREGQQLAQALTYLKGMPLRFVYVMLNDLNLWDVVSSKTKDLVSKDKSAHFYKWMQREAEKLQGIKDSELQLDLLLQLSRVLKLAGRSYHNSYEIEKQCADITAEVFKQLQKKHKSFAAVYDQSYSKNKLEFIIHWEMAEMYTHLIEQRKDSENDSSSAVWLDEIISFLQELPDYQQEQIKQSLHLSGWSKAELTAALQQDAFGTFTAIAERAGFRFYKVLLQGYSNQSDANDLPSDDVAYFSWMANPNLLLSLIFKSGGILYRYQNLLFNKGLLPIVLLEAALPYLSESEEDFDQGKYLEEMVLVWESRFEQYRLMLRKVNELVIQGNDWKETLERLHQEKKKMESEAYQTNVYHQQLLQRLTQLLKRDPERPYFGELSVKNNRLQESLMKVTAKLDREASAKRGVVGRISSFVKSSYYHTEKVQLEKKIEKVFQEMNSLVLEKYQDYEPELVEKINETGGNLQKIQDEMQNLDEEITAYEEKLREAADQEKEVRSQITEAEKRTYGLSEVYEIEMEKKAVHSAEE